MAPDSPPDPVIVSSDRLADLEPYCTHIYHQEPDRWSSIFPWEFPHDSSREEEEAFLREWFDEREIRMQGGAHGQGNGFRFLKSVWWWIALWNLNTRIPQFTHWWLAKPSSVELLNDQSMHPYLLRSDVEVSTFFLDDERKTYGDKFLGWVIPYLQMTIKEMIEKQRTEGKPALTLDTTVGDGLAVDKPVAHSEPDSAQPADTTPKITQSAVCPPTQLKEVAEASAAAPQTAPLPPRPFELPQAAYGHQPVSPQSSFQDRSSTQPTFQDQALVQSTFQQPSMQPLFQQVSMQSTFQQPSMQSTFKEQPSMQSTFKEQPSMQSNFHEQPLGRKYSGSKRYNKSSSQHSNRRSSFKERNAPVYASPPFYSQAPMPMNNANRGSSTGSMSFPQPMLQGHSFSHQDQYMAPQHAQSFGPMHQQMNQPIRYMQGYQNMPFTDPFADRTNFQEHNRAFSGERSMPFYQDSHGSHGDHRQNSYGSRGGASGRARGNSHGRGRGRGRNSFSSNDQHYPNMNMEASHHNMPFPEPAGHVFAPRYRRESVIQEEKNWRSGSDDPQGRFTDAPADENVAPRQSSYGEMVSPSSYQSRPTPVYATKPPHDAEIERVAISDPPSAHHTARTPSLPAPPMPNLPDPEQMTREECCGQDWIGSDCVYADTLVLFNVPMSMEDDHITAFMSQFGQVYPVRRNVAKTHQMVFANFKSVAGARNCILNRPDHWPDGSPFRVQVSKHFWDPTHSKYIFRGRSAGGAGNPSEAQKNLNAPSHSILARPEADTSSNQGKGNDQPAVEMQHSGQTTPTLSTASTPKKTKKKPKSSKTKNHRQKDEEDLRKASQSLKLEQHLRAQGDDVTPVVKPMEGQKAAEERPASAVDKKKHLDSDMSLLPNPQRSLSVQTEHETSSEPAFTPTDRIEARLPVTISHDSDNLAPVVVATSQALASGNVADKDVQDPASAPPTAAPVLKSDNADDVPREELFREAQKTKNETATKAAVDPDVSFTTTDEAKTSTPIKRDDTMIDDSFHTASGSPDTIKPNREDKVDAVLNSTASGTIYVEDFSASPVEHEEKHQADADIGNVPAPPTPVSSSDGSEKARTPQPPAISTNFPPKADTLEVPQHVSPGAGSAMPTPHTAYFTAPNTPAVAQESPKEDKGKAKLTPLNKLNQSEPPRAESAAPASKNKENVAPSTSAQKKPEKPEKPKGPAQTESLSLFGKKREKEKKPKAVKQATLKGKPKGFDANGTVDGGAGNASRAASITAQPKATEATEATSTKGGEEMSRTDSKMSNTLKKRNKKKKETDTAQDTGKATLEELAARHEPSQGQASPTKRRGITERISEFFRGGQPSTSPEKTAESKPWSKLLTNDKGQDRAQEVEQKVHDHLPGSDAVGAKASVLTTPAVTPPVLNDEAHSDGAKPQPVDEIQSAKQEIEDAETIGLGIVRSETSSTSTSGKESKSLTKAQKKSLKRRFARLSDNQSSILTTSDTPVLSSPTGRPTTLSEVFHFGDGGIIKDDKSDASSVTFGRITPTSEVCSPTTASNPVRKLPLKTVGKGHLVEEKRPRWKNKKMFKIQEIQDDDDDNEEDDEDEEQENEEESDDQAVYVVPTSSNSNDNRTSTASEALYPTIDDKVFIYLGPGQRGDMEREDAERVARVAESKARMAKLQQEEQQAQFRQKLRKQGKMLQPALETAQTQTQDEGLSPSVDFEDVGMLTLTFLAVSALWSANATSSPSEGGVLGKAEDEDGGGEGGSAADPSAD